MLFWNEECLLNQVNNSKKKKKKKQTNACGNSSININGLQFLSSDK